MARTMLREEQRDRMKNLLPGTAKDCGFTAKDNRLFVESVLWIARTGSPLKDLPESSGHWQRVYVRYNRWSKKGVKQAVRDAIRRSGFGISHGGWQYRASSPAECPKKQNRTSKALVDRAVG